MRRATEVVIEAAVMCVLLFAFFGLVLYICNWLGF